MKNLFKTVIAGACLVFATSFAANAQVKQGYIYFTAIVEAMPQRAVMIKTLQDYQKTFVDRLQAMQAELQTKGKAYDAADKTKMSDAVRLQTESEITDMQKRIQDYSNTAQQAMEAKQNELTKPLVDAVKTAADAVAKEKGYTYVFDATSQIIVVAPAGDDLTGAVKLKMGIVK